MSIYISVAGLFLVCFAAWYAEWEAERDYDTIASGRPITRYDHRVRWVVRAATMCVLPLALACFDGAMGNPRWWSWAALACMCGAVFSLAFRRRLNKLRKLPMDYMSSSNAYDSLFLGVFGSNAGRMATRFEVACAAILYVLAVVTSN